MNRERRPQGSLWNENPSAAREDARGWGARSERPAGRNHAADTQEPKKVVRRTLRPAVEESGQKTPVRKRPEAEDAGRVRKTAVTSAAPVPSGNAGGEDGAKKSKKRKRAKKAVNIASNPSVNPPSVRKRDQRPVTADWAHLSVEEELKRRGLKLPPGMRPEDLQLPSYHGKGTERPAGTVKRPERPAGAVKRPETAVKRPETPVKRQETPAKRPAAQKEVFREEMNRDARREKRPQPVRDEMPERGMAPKKMGAVKPESDGKMPERAARQEADRVRREEPESRVPVKKTPAPVAKKQETRATEVRRPELRKQEPVVKTPRAAVETPRPERETRQESRREMRSQTRPEAGPQRTEMREKPVTREKMPEKPAVKPAPVKHAAEKTPMKLPAKHVAEKMPAKKAVQPEKAVAEQRPTKKAEPRMPEPRKVEYEKKTPAISAEKPRQEMKKPAVKPAEKPISAAKPAPAASTPSVPVKTEGGRAKKSISPEFAAFGLSREVLYGLADAEYQTPTEIQQALIPVALEGHDLMGQSRTGTGKTAAFAIPILETIKYQEDVFAPQALILVPTRELAVQVKAETRKLSEYTDFEILAVYGGVPLPPQVATLREGVDIVVGTPGRVLDHIKRGSLKLGHLKVVVLDEADRMLDVGFRPDIEKILKQCPQSRQTMLLTATLSSDVRYLARNFMREPVILDCSPKDLSCETIEQFYFTVDPELKFDLLERLLEREQPRQAIIFCRTKRGTEKIYRRLSKHLKGVDVIHGDLQQRQRDRVMDSFRSGKTRFLVATDVVGRGIDVSNISHIINYDIPSFCDDYVHRVGRTGRMGREGVAFSFVTPEEGSELTKIEMRINRLLQRDEIPGFSSVASVSQVQSISQAQLAGGDAEDKDGGETQEPEKPVRDPRRRKIRRAL